MIPITTFAGRRVAVFGLARSGLASVRALEAGGAKVSAWDDGEKSRERAVAEGFALTDLSKCRLDRLCRPRACARRAADTSQAPLDGRAREGA